MIFLNISILIFIILESINVIILYFFPDCKYGNSVGIFKPWFDIKYNISCELFAKYMTNWVAGVKLIFILLLVVILFRADEQTKVLTVFCMILSISTYFFRLNPIIKRLDSMNEIIPKGYSKTLSQMIIGFLLMFCASLFLYFFI